MIRPGRPLRYELKFVACETAEPHLLQWLKLHPIGFREAYPPRRVNSIYFDSFDYDDYAQTLAGLVNRAKVRFRWYGDGLTAAIRGQVEVKLKRDRLSAKLVYPFDMDIDLDRSWSDLHRALLRALPAQGRPWLVERPCPMIINRYRRYYWETIDRTLRVTVDVDHQVFEQRGRSRPNLARPTPVARNAILEVKVGPENIAAARTCLSGLPLVLSRNSKYCNSLHAVSA